MTTLSFFTTQESTILLNAVWGDRPKELILQELDLVKTTPQHACFFQLFYDGG